MNPVILKACPMKQQIGIIPTTRPTMPPDINMQQNESVRLWFEFWQAVYDRAQTGAFVENKDGDGI